MRQTPPDPASGWSREIVTLRDAIIVPSRGHGLARVSGVLDGKGRPVEHAQCWRDHRNLTPPPSVPEGDIIPLPGRHLFMGTFWQHFGHFLTESLSRIWGLEHGDFQSLLFLPRMSPGKTASGLSKVPPVPHIAEVLHLYGTNLPACTANHALRVEELVVPGQGFGLGPISAGTPEFRDFVARRFAQGIAPRDVGTKIYISRSGLPREARGLLFEHFIEANLESEGYQIYRPEEDSVADQIATYRGASVVLGLEGSPFHLLGLVARADQKIGIIRRRHSENARHMVAQFTGFTGRPPDVIDALNGEWISRNRRAAGRFHLGELDFARLRHDLIETGYISADSDWIAPDAALFAEERERFARLTGEELVALPKGMSTSVYRRRVAVQRSDPNWGKSA